MPTPEQYDKYCRQPRKRIDRSQLPIVMVPYHPNGVPVSEHGEHPCEHLLINNVTGFCGYCETKVV